MKLFSILLTVLALHTGTLFAQDSTSTAMDFNRPDCYGSNHHLFADLDSGKAVVLFFYMPNCGSCPPPAKQVNAMLNDVNKMFPGKVKAYAMPYNNSTNCSKVNSWVTTNQLTFYTPMDSGETQVAYYGGFGMPTVVLLGGQDHKVLFSTQSYTKSDTATMHQQINELFGVSSGIKQLGNPINNLHVFPVPANDFLSVEVQLKENSSISISLVDMSGKVLRSTSPEKYATGTFLKKLDVSGLAKGNYLLQVNANGLVSSRKISIIH